MNRAVLILAGIFLIFSAYSQNDISWDIKTGNEVAQKVEKAIGLTHVPTAEATVKAVGDRLVSQLTSNPFVFSFQIIDQPEPNAFALPGGHIYISRGLLALIATEDELAGVLGHEINHVIYRHSAKQKKKSLLPTIIAVPGIILGSTLGGNLGDKVAAPFLGTGRLFLASYSRKQESEADDAGIQLAAKAGYKPGALGDILHRMELSLESESGQPHPFSFFNDHPMTPDRMKAIETLSQTLSVSSMKPLFTLNDFLRSFDAIPFGPNPSKGVFNRNIFLHPTLKIHWTLPEGWKYANEATAAGAAQNESQIVVMIAGKEQQLDTLIDNFVNGYYARTRKQPISDGKLKMRDRTASEIILPSTQTNKIIYTVWFKKDNMTYVILATGDKSQTEVFRKSSATFRDLDPADFTLITNKELNTIPSLSDESCVQISQRTGNTVTPKFMALMNGIPEEGKLKKGYPVKTVLSKPYLPVSK